MMCVLGSGGVIKAKMVVGRAARGRKKFDKIALPKLETTTRGKTTKLKLLSARNNCRKYR